MTTQFESPPQGRPLFSDRLEDGRCVKRPASYDAGPVFSANLRAFPTSQSALTARTKRYGLTPCSLSASYAAGGSFPARSLTGQDLRAMRRCYKRESRNVINLCRHFLGFNARAPRPRATQAPMLVFLISRVPAQPEKEQKGGGFRTQTNEGGFVLMALLDRACPTLVRPVLPGLYVRTFSSDNVS